MYFWASGWQKLGMPETESLSHYFRQLEDPRIARSKGHALHDILIISVCALLCGAEGFVDREEFGKAQRDWLGQLLSSLSPHAPELARAIRGHWGIENSLHWVLDVALREDDCRVRTGHAATHLATLRHLALNLLRQDTTKKRGIRTKQKIAGWDHHYLIKLLPI